MRFFRRRDKSLITPQTAPSISPTLPVGIGHLIVTRFGIGKSDPVYFSRRIRFLRNTLLPSLVAQDCQNFVWYCVVDACIPEDNLQQLNRLLSSRNNLRIWRHDIFRARQFLPQCGPLSRDAFVAPAGVLITRVDDDDALAAEYVGAVQSELSHMLEDSGDRSDILFCYPAGVQYLPELKSMSMWSYPDVSVQSMFTTVPDERSPYLMNHATARETIKVNGGRAKVIQTANPMWLRVLHSTSEAREHAKLENALKRADRKINRAADVSQMLSRFGLDETLGSEMLATLREYPVYNTPFLRDGAYGPKLKRMQAKKELLEVFFEKERTLADTTSIEAQESISRQLSALREALYQC